MSGSCASNDSAKAAAAPVPPDLDRLSPADLPAKVPTDLNLPVATREEWARDLFDERGNLVVPQPSDPERWRSFIGWTKTVNPELRKRISALSGPMFQALETAVRE